MTDDGLLRRATRIASVMARHGVRDFVLTRGEDDETMRRRARGLRDALEELGPTFSKLGQILSTRPDLLPKVFIDELETLQEKVTPLTEAEVVRAVERSLGVSWEDAFDSIDPVPLAAGTIAQVHRAVLEDGEQVVVKVQRPGAAEQIAQDLELLRMFAEKTAVTDSLSRVIDLRALTEHLAEGLQKELDFHHEAAAMDRMRAILTQYDRLAVPAVHHAFTAKGLLVIEYVDGTAIKDAPEGAARAEAARQLLQSYFTQLLGEGFFHADPHPGNLRWCDGKIYFLDFGMVGELDEETRDTLLLLLMAVWQEDAEFVVESMLSLSGPGDDADRDLDRFVADIDEFLKKYRYLSLKDAQLGPLLNDLMTVALEHQVPLPASLALTGKALAQMQLATAELDPTLDPFAVVGAFVSRHVVRKLRGGMTPAKMLYEAQKTRARLARMFVSIEGLMAGARDGRLKVQFRGTERLEETIGRVGRRLALSLVSTAAIVSTAIAATSPEVPEWATATGMGVGVTFAGALVWDLLRRR